MPDTNAHRDSVPPSGSLPFFARFLEGQDNARQTAPQQGMTLKYPSDRDEWEPFLDAQTTEGITLQAAPEKSMTLKYPSDRDEWEPFLDN